jgi:hypothetical protein
VARAISEIIFKYHGVLLEFYGLWLDFAERQGQTVKRLGFFLVQIYSSMEKSQWTQSTICGPLGHRFMVDWPWPVEGASSKLGPAATAGHGSSPKVVQQGEGCTGSPL